MNSETDIDQLNITEAFNTLQEYLSYIGEKDEDEQEIYPDLPETYEKARHGINLKFDIYDYINQTITIKTKTGKVQYRNKNFNLTDFWTELEERTILIRKWLKNNQPERQTTRAYET